MMKKRHTWFAALAILGVGLGIGSERAEARGAVLKIDGANVYVDLGTDAGVVNGSQLTLFHVISVKHPVTGKAVRDTFPLAKLTVVNAGQKISIAVVPGPFRQRVKVGDEIELASEPVAAVDPWAKPARPVDPYGNASAGPPPETLVGRQKKIKKAKKRLATIARIEAAWAATLGQSPARRVELWREYLAANSQTPYQKVVGRAIASLEALIESSVPPTDEGRARALAKARMRTLARLGQFATTDSLVHARPKRIDEGVALSLAFLATEPDSIADAWLYYRTAGDDAYLRIQLIGEGDSYIVGEVPADSVRPPGVEYFVEVRSHGQEAEPRAVVGRDARPVRVEVIEKPGPVPIDQRGRSQVSVILDYVDFDGLGDGKKFDQYWYGEIDFKYRFRKRGLYSLRLGFGTMNGTGGPKDVIDNDPNDACLDVNGNSPCRDVAYNYAYTELEWHFTDYFGVALRPQWGSAYRDGGAASNADREFFDAFGLRGRLRFGREDGSNLILGAAATQELGRLFEAGFNWDVIKEVPLVFSVHVTDQPVIEDFGVRLIADVGLRYFPWVYPSLRVAYQARDIDHAGLSGGVAANFDW